MNIKYNEKNNYYYIAYVVISILLGHNNENFINYFLMVLYIHNWN